MTFSLLSVVILGITTAIIYKKSKKSYKHGLSRSLTDLAILLCGAIFSAIVSMLLSSLIVTIVMSSVTISGGEEFVNLLLGALELLVAMILSVLIYIPVFFAMKSFLRRLFVFISKTATRKSRRKIKKKEPQYLSEEAPFYVRHDKEIAAWIGAFSGLVLAIVMFMPLIGLLETADDIVDLVAEMTQDASIAETPEARLLDHYSHDFGATVLRASGGRVLYDLTARTTCGGDWTCINQEVATIRAIRTAEIVNEFQTDGQLTGSNTQKVQGVLDELQKSLCLRVVLVEFIKGASQSWMQYDPYLGVSRPNLGNYSAIDDLFDSMLFVCSTTNIDTYDADLKTILGVVAIMEEYPAIFSGDDYDTFMMDFVEGDALERIEDELYKNPRMSAVNAAVDGVIMNLIATELSVLEYGIEGQPVIYQGIADVLNDASGLPDGSVKMTAIANGIADNFAQHGVYLPPAMENRLASILVSTVPTDQTHTEQSIQEYFDSYLQTEN